MQQKFDIRVISLAGQIDRRKNIEHLFAGSQVTWSFMDAIVGKTPEAYGSLWQHYDRSRRLQLLGYEMRDNEIACFLSHRKVWKECIANGKPLLILEDDIKLHPEFSHIAKAMDMIPTLLEYLKDGFFIRIGNLGEQKHTVVKKIQNTHLIRCKKDPLGTCAYIVTPTVAQKLLTHSEKFSAPVDHYLWHGWVHGCHLLDMTPPIFFTDDGDTPSTIGTRKKPQIPAYKKIAREWHRAIQRHHESVYSKNLLNTLRTHFSDNIN